MAADLDTVTRMPLQTSALGGVDKPVYDWLEQHFGSAPSTFFRQLRWRIGWEADVLIGGQNTEVLVRGSRGKDHRSPISMQQEAQVHGIMERHGVRAPHVYGMIEEPLSIVMEKLEGGINSELITDENARWKVRSEFIQALAKLHAIPVEEFGEIGMFVPKTPQEIAFNLYGPCIDIVRERLGSQPFGLVEFFARWLERNIPKNRNRCGFVTADAGQFLYKGDRFTGLIDFEVSYLGDPAAEFAGMRLRNTTEPLGDISRLCDYYESLTGDRISKAAIEYHSAGFASTNSMLMWPMMFEPEPDNDYVAYLQFCVATSRWGLAAMAEVSNVKLPNLPPPVLNSALPFDAASTHLQTHLAGWKTGDTELNFYLEQAGVLAQYLDRCHKYGATILAADLADAETLTGKKLNTRAEADAAVDAFVRNADATADAALILFFHGWLHRQNFLLKGCGSQSYLTGQTLQPIARRPADDDK
jgi:aminoglycoside phosphotransferase (APT) family kinase protein